MLVGGRGARLAIARAGAGAKSGRVVPPLATVVFLSLIGDKYQIYKYDRFIGWVWL